MVVVDDIHEERQHVDTGIHGTWFLVKVLLAHDRADLLHLVAIQRDEPSWGAMLERRKCVSPQPVFFFLNY